MGRRNGGPEKSGVRGAREFDEEEEEPGYSRLASLEVSLLMHVYSVSSFIIEILKLLKDFRVQNQNQKT